jgi:hypothetical protein
LIRPGRHLILVKAQAPLIERIYANCQAGLRSMSTDLSTSFFIAKLLGPIFMLLGLSVLLREHAFKAILQDVARNAALVYLSGFLSFISGLLLVLTHNIWSQDWRLLITLIGWIAIARGFVTIFQPQWAVALFTRFVERQTVFYSAAAIDILLGLVLVYIGYFP